MDDADLAGERNEAFRDAALKIIRDAAAKPRVYTGLCRYCDATLPKRVEKRDDKNPPPVFCNTDCRNDYDKEQKSKNLNRR